MGAHAYFYFTPHQDDLQVALAQLRQREFDAGRYDPGLAMAAVKNPGQGISQMYQVTFPLSETSIAPGAQHDTIQSVFEDVTEDGTGSILDILGITEKPDIFSASPVPQETLIKLFGTKHPTRVQIEEILLAYPAPPDLPVEELFWDQLGRGQARYIITYESDRPDQIFFAGLSLD